MQRLLPALVIAARLCGFAPDVAAQESASTPSASELDRGLAWLVRSQRPDGSWECRIGYLLNDRYMAQESRENVGVTALAGLALLRAGGHDAEVDRAAGFLSQSSHESPIGYIAAHGTRLVEHALAVRFLAEVQAKRPQPAWEDAVWRGAGILVRSQNSEGGWRYQPTPCDADLPFTAPPYEALLAARAVGVDVPEDSLRAARKFAAKCGSQSEDGSFAYQYLPANRTRFTFGTTAVGVFLLLSGQDRTDRTASPDSPKPDPAVPNAAPLIARGLDYLFRSLRQVELGEFAYFFDHYYAVDAANLSEDPRGKAYQNGLRTELLASQNADGSWDDEIGSAYATAMACLILQMLR